MGELYVAAGHTGPPPSSRSARAAAPAAVEEIVIEELPVAEPEEEPAPAAPPAAAGGDAADDVEGARLIALNMALNGQSRAETDKYLADNFELSDRGALLDEVYATVEG
jgi:hypothetical protein